MRKLASIKKIDEISPILNSDNLELATIGGWKSVVKKNEFKVGELVVYFEVDSFLPVRPEFEFLRKNCFKSGNGQEGFRLKTIKLRGCLSQGLVLSLQTLSVTGQEGDDLTEALNVKHYDDVFYDTSVKAILSGNQKGSFPCFIKKTDQERIQNLTSWFDNYLKKHTYEVTEKLDGTSCTVFYNEEIGVCSRNFELKLDDPSTYVNTTAEVRHKLEQYCQKNNCKLALQGEIIGPGIQQNKYKLKEHRFYLFDIFDITTQTYVDCKKRHKIVSDLNIYHVPVVAVRELPSSVEEILTMAEKESVLCDTEREGLVFKSTDGTTSFKAISNAFLLKSK